MADPQRSSLGDQIQDSNTALPTVALPSRSLSPTVEDEGAEQLVEPSVAPKDSVASSPSHFTTTQEVTAKPQTIRDVDPDQVYRSLVAQLPSEVHTESVHNGCKEDMRVLRDLRPVPIGQDGSEVPIDSSDNIDYIEKGVIPQPPNGLNVKLAGNAKCFPCVKQHRKCRGTSVVNGKCEMCRGEHGAQKRNCYWIQPLEGIWTESMARRMAHGYTIPENTRAGIAAAEAAGKPRKKRANKKKEESVGGEKKVKESVEVEEDTEENEPTGHGIAEEAATATTGTTIANAPTYGQFTPNQHTDFNHLTFASAHTQLLVPAPGHALETQPLRLPSEGGNVAPWYVRQQTRILIILCKKLVEQGLVDSSPGINFNNMLSLLSSEWDGIELDPRLPRADWRQGFFQWINYVLEEDEGLPSSQVFAWNTHPL